MEDSSTDLLPLIKAMQVLQPYLNEIVNPISYFPESAGEGATLVTTQYSGGMPASTFRNYAHRVFRDFIRGVTEGSAR